MAMLTVFAKIESPSRGVYFAPMDTLPGNGFDLSIFRVKS
jgi:hypothetical protein